MNDMTMGELLNVYATAKQFRPATTHEYRYCLKTRLKWFDLRLSEITPALLVDKENSLIAESRLLNRNLSGAAKAINVAHALLAFVGQNPRAIIKEPSIKIETCKKQTKPAPSKNTFSELLERYCIDKGISEVTSANYRSRLKRVNWPDFPLDTLTEEILSEKIQFVENQGKENGKSQIWVYQACKIIYCLVDYANAKGLIKVKAPRHWKGLKKVDQPAPISMPPKLLRRVRPVVTDGITFGEMFRAYIEHHAKLHCRSWEKTESYHRYLADWDSIFAANISKFDVQELFQRIGTSNGKTTANRVIEIVRTVFNRAIEWEIFEGTNPATGVRFFKLQSRDRFLEVDEIRRLVEAASTLRYPTTRDFLLMCLFTAARRSNVAAMRWDEISFDTGIWSVPITKNGTPQKIPLTPSAISILKERKSTSLSEWVFNSNRSKTGYLTKPETAWYALLERANLKNVRIHDLRRTLASWEAMTNANISVIAATLNHKDLKSVQIYARMQVEPVREAMTVATTKMLSGITVLEEAQHDVFTKA